jgi:hypothetical protein
VAEPPRARYGRLRANAIETLRTAAKGHTAHNALQLSRYSRNGFVKKALNDEGCARIVKADGLGEGAARDRQPSGSIDGAAEGPGGALFTIRPEGNSTGRLVQFQSTGPLLDDETVVFSRLWFFGDTPVSGAKREIH